MEVNKMENEKPLEILVVDDRTENRMVAQEYFNTRTDVKVDFATSYSEGLQKLREGLYAIGIFDLELPRMEGSEPEKLGFELAREAERYMMPWAVITTGIDHHNCKAAFVSYCWNGLIDPSEAVRNNHRRDIIREITETPKTDPKCWQRVYETLIGNTPDIAELVAAREMKYRMLGKGLIK